MCGICGYIGKRKITHEELQACNDTMVHRGPDDSGIVCYTEDKIQIALAHRRLSILDLSKLGHQPMESHDGIVAVAFNGEIYNYRELKKEINYPFQSNSDTEVIIAAYLQWGIGFLQHLDGMFAVALYDRKQKKLLLVRDKLGKKPLYCYENDGDIFFASTLNAIMKYPEFHSELDRDSIRQLLVRAYIISPYTIFTKVRKVNPGELWVCDGEKIEIRKYWELYHHYETARLSFSGTYDEAKNELDKRLSQAVTKRLHADVPVGVLLSGGIDSSLVALQAVRNSKEQVHTYTIGFSDKKYNEAEYAKAIAEYLGCRHHELYIDESFLLDILNQVEIAYDEPFADSSQIAMMIVAKQARESGVKVLLSGDGGDELFCGYPIYHVEKIAQKLDRIGGIIYKALPDCWLQKLPFYVRSIVFNRDERFKTQFNMIGYRSLVDEMIPGKSVLYDESEIFESDWIVRRMMLDQKSYLPDDNLCKVDRASMFYSVEVRSPILDDEVVDFAHSIKQSYRCSGRITKKIMRDILYEGIPKSMLERPKMGFSIPTEEWLKGALKEELVAFSRQEHLRNQGIFEPKKSQNIIDEWLNNKTKASRGRNYKEIMWAFYIFQKWYQKYIAL